MTKGTLTLAVAFAATILSLPGAVADSGFIFWHYNDGENPATVKCDVSRLIISRSNRSNQYINTLE